MEELGLLVAIFLLIVLVQHQHRQASEKFEESRGMGSDVEPPPSRAIPEPETPEEVPVKNHFVESVMPKPYTMYGTKSGASQIINLGMGIGPNMKLSDELDKIVMGEIGGDTISSQRQWGKNKVSEAVVRLADNVIEANYGQYFGMSLTR